MRRRRCAQVHEQTFRDGRFFVAREVECRTMGAKACRNELKILYTGGPFGADVWERLGALGSVEVFEASKLSAKMKDIVRVRGEGVRVEGARDGELVVAFFSEGFRRARHRVEALLVGIGASPR